MPPVTAVWYTQWYTRRTWASNVLMSGTRVFDGGVHLSPQRLVSIANCQVSESLNGKVGGCYPQSVRLFLGWNPLVKLELHSAGLPELPQRGSANTTGHTVGACGLVSLCNATQQYPTREELLRVQTAIGKRDLR